jgi:hypothetical protein
VTVAIEPQRRTRIATETVRRRWRLAVLLGLVVLLALAALVVVLAEQSAQANRTTAVLTATKDIRAGTTITADELGVANVRVDDRAVLASLVDASGRGRLIGEVATDSVRAGSLIPAGLGAPKDSVSMWEVPLPVKRMPPKLKAGDHVALLVSGTGKSGEPVVVVAMQDVRVLDVRPDLVDLWLPATATAQMQAYAERGGIIVARMQPGAVQPNLPAGGGG